MTVLVRCLFLGGSTIDGRIECPAAAVVRASHSATSRPKLPGVLIRLKNDRRRSENVRSAEKCRR